MGSNVMMYAAFTGGTQNALAAIDVPIDGNLVGVSWNCYADMDADQDVMQCQLSFGSTLATTNDSRQVISQCVQSASQVTAASTVAVGTNYYDEVDLPVAAGERIYLHSGSTAALTGAMWCMLHFDFDVDKPRGRRR